MKNKAFTLIELLIIITIITILTSSGVIYFFKQVSSIRLSSEIEKINDIIDNLDSKVDNKKIFDYSLYIDKNSLGFTGSINNLGLYNRQKLNLNFTTGTGTITSNSGTILKIYSGIKFQGEKIIDSSEEYKYNFLKNIESKISASYSGNTLNNIIINYYSSDNIIKNNENKLELTKINTQSDKNGTNYNNIIIKNINGKKYILNNLTQLNKIYLFFEREGLEKFVEIKK